MSDFWRNWLTVWCVAVGMSGLGLVAGGFDATSGPTRLFFHLLNGPAPLELDNQMRFSLAVLGAVTLGWSLTLLAAIQAAIALGPRGRSIWWLITGGATAWFVLDTPMSILTGYQANALPNIVIFATFMLPILRSGVLRHTPAPSV